MTQPTCEFSGTSGSTTRMKPPTGTPPAVVKLTTAVPVYAGASTAESTCSRPVNAPPVIASVLTLDALSMMLPELSYVVIDVLVPAASCFVGVVTFEIVKTTSVSCPIAFDDSSNSMLRPPDPTTALVATGTFPAGSPKLTTADAPIRQPSCSPDSSGNTSLILPPTGTRPAVVKLTSAVPVYAGVAVSRWTHGLAVIRPAVIAGISNLFCSKPTLSIITPAAFLVMHVANDVSGVIPDGECTFEMLNLIVVEASMLVPSVAM
jgi:hypothetical protein